MSADQQVIYRDRIRDYGLRMSSNSSKAAAFPYLLIFIFFLLPFVEFSCQEQRLATLNGYQVAFGGEIEPPPLFKDLNNFAREAAGPNATMSKPKMTTTEPTKILIGALAASLVAALLAMARVHLLSALAGVLAIVLVIMTPEDINKQLRQQAVIVAKYQSGFYAIIATLAIGAGLSTLLAFTKKDP